MASQRQRPVGGRATPESLMSCCDPHLDPCFPRSCPSSLPPPSQFSEVTQQVPQQGLGPGGNCDLVRWGHQTPLLPTTKAGIHPSHATPATAHLDKAGAQSQSTWAGSCIHHLPASWVSLTDPCLTFLVCTLWIMIVTTSQDCCKENLVRLILFCSLGTPPFCPLARKLELYLSHSAIYFL